MFELFEGEREFGSSFASLVENQLLLCFLPFPFLLLEDHPFLVQLPPLFQELQSEMMEVIRITVPVKLWTHNNISNENYFQVMYVFPR